MGAPAAALDPYGTDLLDRGRHPEVRRPVCRVDTTSPQGFHSWQHQSRGVWGGTGQATSEPYPHTEPLPSSPQHPPLLWCCLRLRGYAAQTVATRHNAAVGATVQQSGSVWVKGDAAAPPLWARSVACALFCLQKSAALDADGADLVRPLLKGRKGARGKERSGSPVLCLIKHYR